MARRRLVVGLTAFVALNGAFIGGWVVGHRASPSGRLATFRAGPEFESLSFAYPASWQARTSTAMSSFSSSIVYLSNQAMGLPCSDGTCGWPVTRLQPGGVIVEWTERGFPDRTFDKAAGEPLTVAGRRAKLSVRSGGCGSIVADVVMSVVVERPEAPDNWYELDACIRGPGVQEIESQVRAILASTTLPGRESARPPGGGSQPSG